MLKWTRRILLFLLLGAMVNVAVAWGCAAIHANQLDAPFRFEQFKWFETNSAGERGHIDVISRSGFEAVRDGYFLELIMVNEERFFDDEERFPSRRAQPHTGPIWWDTKRATRLQDKQFATGWPALALRAQRGTVWDSHPPDWATLPGPQVFEPQWFGAIDLSRWTRAPAPLADAVLPLRVIPVGFALNTMFYGGLLLLLATAITAARSALRRRRNLCPACGYPRGTSPVCTECGAPLPC